MQDKTIDYVLRYTWQTVSKMYNEEAAKYGATMATGFALLSIDKDKGIPSTALGPRMGMEATSLTRTLKSMEERGLIVRRKNPADGRGVLLFLTEEGKQFNEVIKSKITEAQLKNFLEVAEIINEQILEKEIFESSAVLIK
jgi:DNA-binding MarR family transcriptional regulator